MSQFVNLKVIDSYKDANQLKQANLIWWHDKHKGLICAFEKTKLKWHDSRFYSDFEGDDIYHFTSSSTLVYSIPSSLLLDIMPLMPECNQ